jgi:3-mercaptopyruvate sulfurtransferase SseA
MGLNAGMQVVVYDRQGSSFCGRLWWMLKWCGHEAVAVLDGGLAAWQAIGGALESEADYGDPWIVNEINTHVVLIGRPVELKVVEECFPICR